MDNLPHAFEHLYDSRHVNQSGPAPRDEVQGDLWTRTAVAAGRLNRAHAELVDIAVELVEGQHWGDRGFRSPDQARPPQRRHHRRRRRRRTAQCE